MRRRPILIIFHQIHTNFNSWKKISTLEKKFQLLKKKQDQWATTAAFSSAAHFFLQISRFKNQLIIVEYFTIAIENGL